MKHIYIACTFAALSWNVCGQSNTVATGGSATGVGGSATFTVGQIDYSNATGASGSMNQGVQQPFEFFKDVGFEEYSDLTIQLYPNPTTDWITLATDKLFEGINYELIDSRGRKVKSNIINTLETTIDMSDCSEGIYHLQVKDSGTIRQSFKIIKH